MYFTKVFLGLLNFCFVKTLPLDQFYINGDSGLNDQQFFYNYQARSGYYYPDDINKPVFQSQLGMSPQYHNLVYNYVKDFAGTEPPVHVSTFPTYIAPNRDQIFSQGNVPDSSQNFESVNAETDPKPVLGDIQSGTKSDSLLPSDYFSLGNHPSSQFYGQFDAIKTKRIQYNSNPTSLPPVGGVISNYALLRAHQNPQNLLQLPGTVKDNESNLQHIKRQATDNSDGVEILAEPLQNPKASDDCESNKDDETKDKDEEQMPEINPGIAQSKPSAIALAGPGGVAQASPVGTALVGQGGLAVAAPSGTAVAGPAGQGAVPIFIGGGEKQKTSEKTSEKNSEKGSEKGSEETTEKNEQSDYY